MHRRPPGPDPGTARDRIDDPVEPPGGDPRHGLHWWRELFYVGVFYLLYSATRNLFGSAGGGSTTHALHNAERVMRLEQWLGIFREQEVQSWFLGWPWFLRIWNIYYGTLHFIVPIVVLIVMFRRWPAAYRLWRNTLAFTTGLALLGFSLFPLMPPRLLCDCLYGGGAASDRGFVDTIERYGGLWSFDSGTVKSISNQYAAMPSLHVAWSLWCALVLIPRLRHRWAKVLVALYPLTTVFAIVVTANHYLLDAVGGVAVLGVGYLLARLVTGSASGRGRAEAGSQARSAAGA
ncbi:MAG: phosphatase PAP2 family protein [Acidimicrobiales bacterium]